MKVLEASSLAEITFTLNGESARGTCPPRMHLADFLRHRCHKLGTHIGCEHGVCGACTVLVDGRAVRSCLLYAVQIEGCCVQTVEGLASDTLSELQENFRRFFALQCGFCTAGILMSATDFLNNHLGPTEEDVRHMLSGHICRCTGYDGIVKAILATGQGMQLNDATGHG